MSSSIGVITDSGGISEETTFLNIPCITLRSNTERPETISKGTNILIGDDYKKFSKFLKKMSDVVDKIIEYSKQGRDVLYLSDRRNNLEIIYKILKQNNYDSGFYVGGMKPEQLRDSQKKILY